MTQRGFTLIELLITITIAIIIIGVAAPSFNNTLKRREANKVVDTLQTLIRNGRSYALNSHHNLTICGSSDGWHCNAMWSKGVLMLEDGNRNGIVDGKDRILQSEPLDIQPSQLVWQGFGGKNLIIESFGTSYASNGTFTYCRKDHDPLYSRQVVVSRGGRARHSLDKNNDGVHEDSNGKAIKCP
jgi:type IV fimbrial biogenesis protein FimT